MLIFHSCLFYFLSFLSFFVHLSLSRSLYTLDKPNHHSIDEQNKKTTNQRTTLIIIIGQSGELSGCHNDVQNIKNYLMRHQGYKEDQILVLMDEVGGSTRNGTNDGSSRGPIFPTRQKIILALQQMVAHSQPGDNVSVGGHNFIAFVISVTSKIYIYIKNKMMMMMIASTL